MARRLPPMKSLLAFEAAVRTGSIRKAAQELNLDHSVVSRHLRTLQERYATPIYTSTAQGIRPTEAGLEFAAQVTRSLDLISNAAAKLTSPEKGLVLHVWCMPGFALRWLTPRLPELAKSLPGVEILIKPTDETDEAQLIHEDTTDQWRDWFRLHDVTLPSALHGTRLWQAHLSIEAAKLGQGVALANDFLVREDLAHGSLMKLASPGVMLGAYTLRARKERWNESAIRRFRAWFMREVQSFGV
jgi:DNA-binding transcriptional LysR family regulator